MMHPRRKLRISAFVALCAVFITVMVLEIETILNDAKNVVAYAQNSNNLTAVRSIHHYLTAIATLRHNPELEPILDSFYSDNNFRDSLLIVPALPSPYNSFVYLVAGYRIHGKIAKLILNQSATTFSSDLLEQALDQKALGFLDSLWEVKSKTFVSRDTIYFHAHAIDRTLYHKWVPFLLDNALDAMPARFMVNSMESGKVSTDTVKNDLISVSLRYRGKSIYRRGPSGDRFVAYEQNGFAGDNDMKIYYYLHHTLEFPAFYRRDLEKRLSETMWAVIMMMMTILMAGLTRGHSVFPDRKAFEMNWEREHSHKELQE